MFETVDLRSDTVTLPTREMLETILEAELGDDGYREDSTVNMLQELAAEKMGKEAGLLVPSGTMGNLVSLMSHVDRGELFIAETDSHIAWCYRKRRQREISGVIAKFLHGEKGALDPVEVEETAKMESKAGRKPRLVCIENTHNHAGGVAITPEQTRVLHEVTERNGLKLHIDGARIFNAAVALSVDVKKLTEHADSVMFCVSKGLSAPIGSLVVGNEEFIERARKIRSWLGGGMRQAGIIAAPGIIALTKMTNRLKEDHENARTLAEGLNQLPGIKVDLDTVQTNIVVFNISGLNCSTETFLSMLKDKGVKALPRIGPNIRMVTHRGIEKDDIKYTLEVVSQIAEELTP